MDKRLKKITQKQLVELAEFYLKLYEKVIDFDINAVRSHCKKTTKEQNAKHVKIWQEILEIKDPACLNKIQTKEVVDALACDSFEKDEK